MKVFQIGFGRTGTKSLAAALKRAGLSVLDMKAERLNRTKLVRMWSEGQVESLMMLAQKYDVVEDHPWPFLYSELSERFPEAHFIYSTRNSDAWLRSIINHTLQERGPSENKLRIFGFDTPIGHEDIYVEKFERHREEVRHFFAKRDRFLEIDLSDPDSENNLASFLGLSDISLPMRNKSKPS